MTDTSLKMLRRSLDLTEIARSSGLNPKTVRHDWSDPEGNKATNAYIVTFAREHLYGMRAPWIFDVWSHIIQQWPRDDAIPQDKFVKAIATIYREMLIRPETIARWQVHLHVAAAQHCDPSAMSHDDRSLMHELIDLRHEFDEYVTTLWHLPLRVVLAEMGRRPRPGLDEPTIARELHTSMDGHVLRSLAEGQVRDDDSGRAVGRHTLLLLEGFTEPDEPSPHPPATGGLDVWVRDMASHVTARLHREDTSEDAGPVTVDRATARAALLEACPAEREADVQEAFDAQFPDLQTLREVALERCLRPRVDAVKAMYEVIAPLLPKDVIPAPILRQLVSTIRTAGRTDGNLLRRCRDHHAQGATSYLAELESLLQELLASLDVSRPDKVATTLLGQALDGDHEAVEGLLTVITPDTDGEG
jgi:hypothetical protein